MGWRSEMEAWEDDDDLEDDEDWEDDDWDDIDPDEDWDDDEDDELDEYDDDDLDYEDDEGYPEKKSFTRKTPDDDGVHKIRIV